MAWGTVQMIVSVVCSWTQQLTAIDDEILTSLHNLGFSCNIMHFTLHSLRIHYLGRAAGILHISCNTPVAEKQVLFCVYKVFVVNPKWQKHE